MNMLQEHAVTFTVSAIESRFVMHYVKLNFEERASRARTVQESKVTLVTTDTDPDPHCFCSLTMCL